MLWIPIDKLLRLVGAPVTGTTRLIALAVLVLLVTQFVGGPTKKGRKRKSSSTGKRRTSSKGATSRKSASRSRR